jgi:uncharacterized membrane protein YcfT
MTINPASGNPASGKRVDWIDYAKGWCILMVVMMHSTLGVGEALGNEGALHYVVAWARPFRMPDFFLIAGLFLSRSLKQDWRYYLDRKLVHFLYFYIIWMLIQLLSKQGYLISTDTNSFFKELGLAFLEPYTTLWFIYILPIMFILVKLLQPVPHWIVLLLALSAETYRRITGWHTDWIILDEFPVRFVYFYMGYIFAPLVFRWVDWVQSNMRPAGIILITWSIITAFAVFTPASVLPLRLVPAHMLDTMPVEFGSLAFYPGLSLIFGISGIAAVLAFSGMLAKTGYLAGLRYAGSLSLVIYLSFFLPMALTRTLLIQIGLRNVTLVSILVTVAGILLPLLFYFIVRGTWMQFLFRRPKIFQLTPHKTEYM